MTDTDSSPAVADILTASGVSGLTDDAGPDAVLAALEHLAELVEGKGDLYVSTVREEAVRHLRDAGVGSPARMVDAALRNGRPGEDDETTGPGRRIALTDPEPWEEPVEGSALLRELTRAYARFVALPDGGATALALWTLHAHAHDTAAVSPLLALTSPEKRCGKTTTLHVLGALVPRPLPAANITPAALFRAVEKFRPTLLVDEADSFLRDREELRGVLNSGHAKASAVVVRAVAAGDEYEAAAFSTWAPKAVALIDSGTTLPDTLRDRSVELRMRRRGPGEEVERLRLDRLDELEPLRRKAARWTGDQAEALRGADPHVPPELHDRARDNWRPLLAIADVAGGPWPGRARDAARLLSTGREDDEASARVLLLRDLRDLFQVRGTDRLASRDITSALAEMEERPWPEWRRGDPISTRQLARLLRPFDIGPKDLWIDGRTLKGYEREAFQDAWRRYLRRDPPAEPQGAQEASNGAEKSGSEKRKDGADLADTESTERSGDTTDLADLADGEGGSGSEGGPDEDTDWLEEIDHDPER